MSSSSLSVRPSPSLRPAGIPPLRAPRRRFALLALALGLAGCAGGPTVQEFAGQKPELDLRRYFDGPLVAHGIFTDRSGRVQRRFTVQMRGTWTGEEGVLEEDFTYSDGRQERRVWRLRHEGGGRWSGRADDVVGTAQGEAAGNALRWQYTLRLPVDGRVWEVQFDDWMYLVDEKVMINRAVMSKFGIRLGEVTLAFTRP